MIIIIYGILSSLYELILWMIVARCSICVGSGKLMGGGMLMRDCYECGGTGTTDTIKVDVKPTSLAQIDKRSPSYKKAIKAIQKGHNCSFDEASKIFDEEFEKL